MRGIRVIPESKERDRLAFAFMSNGVSSERQLETAVRQTAALMEQARAAGKKIVVVAGPVVVHTGGVAAVAKLIRSGWVQALLAGNALGVHDIEAALLGTSLGVRQSDGRQEEHGHRNHMRAINAIYHAGGIAKAVESGRLTSGVMYECVKADVPFVLAGSLRDDGPLPDTITDMNHAQDAYAEQLKGAGLVLCLGSMLHSIATGNMLPSWVKIVCVDINPAVATKVSDRGTGQAVGVVTDVGLFLGSAGAKRLHLAKMKRDEAAVYGRARGGRRQRQSAGDRDVAESISHRIRNRNRDAGVHFGVPQDRASGSRHADSTLRAGPVLPGIEIAQDVHSRLSQSGDFSGERGEPDAGRCREGGEAHLGDAGGRFHAARGGPHEDHSQLET